MADDFASKLGDGTRTSLGPHVIMARQTSENVRVGREGTAVTLTIGNSTLRMPWRTALSLGQWLLAKGAEAKFLDGETKQLLIEPDRFREAAGR